MVPFRWTHRVRGLIAGIALALAGLSILGAEYGDAGYGWYFVAVALIAVAWIAAVIPTQMPRTPRERAGARATIEGRLFAASVHFHGVDPGLVFNHLLDGEWKLRGADGYSHLSSDGGRGRVALEVAGTRKDAAAECARRAVEATGASVDDVHVEVLR